MRGIYSEFIDNEVYKESEKDWYVELSRTDMYWYDLLINPTDSGYSFDTRNLIVEYLKNLKKEIEENLEKRFIYFICSRKKVRFNTNKKPQYNPITKKVKIHLLIGREKKKASAKIKFYDVVTNRFSNPTIELTDKYITLTNDSNNKITMSIHDFLSRTDVSFGHSTQVQYVGYTENPHTRPTNGSHSGLNEILHEVSNEEYDTLLFFNLFKVTSRAKNATAMLNFILPNSMTNEIGAEIEGKLIEKCFIFYFDSIYQTKNRDKEMGELKNNLIKLSNENKISSIQFCYELESPNDYWKFFSSKISPKHRHVFTVSLSTSIPIVEEKSEIFSSLMESSLK